MCLIKQIKKDISHKLAKNLDMFYADVNELMNYNYIDENTIKIAGQEYFDKLEADFIKKISDYENTVFSLNLATANKNKNIDTIKKSCLIIFLELNYQDYVKLNVKDSKSLEKLDEMMYDSRNKLLTQYADIVVKIKKMDTDLILKNIIKEIKHYYKN